MAFDQSRVHNRLLAALSPDDFALIDPMLERVQLVLKSVQIEAGRPIRHALFPESGIISTIADLESERIEIGLIGCEGLVGVPVALGTYQTPHTYVVQAAGEGFRIGSGDLRAAIAERPSIFRPLGLYTQSLIVQIAQTAYHYSCDFDPPTYVIRCGEAARVGGIDRDDA